MTRSIGGASARRALHHGCGYAMRRFGASCPGEAAKIRPEFIAMMKSIKRLHEVDHGMKASWPSWRTKKVTHDNIEDVKEGPRRILRTHSTDESTAAPTECTTEGAGQRRPGRRARSRARTEEYFRCISNVEDDRRISIPAAALCAILDEGLYEEEASEDEWQPVQTWTGMIPSGPASPAAAGGQDETADYNEEASGESSADHSSENDGIDSYSASAPSSGSAEESLEGEEKRHAEDQTRTRSQEPSLGMIPLGPASQPGLRRMLRRRSNPQGTRTKGNWESAIEDGASQAGSSEEQEEEPASSGGHSRDAQSSEDVCSDHAPQGNSKLKRRRMDKSPSKRTTMNTAPSRSSSKGKSIEQLLGRRELSYVMKEPMNSEIGEQVWRSIPCDAIETLQMYNYYEPFIKMPPEKSAMLLEKVLEATAGRLQEPNRTPAIGDSGRAWATATSCELARLLCRNLAGARAYSSTLVELERKLPELQKAAKGAQESFDMPRSLLAFGDVMQKLRVCIRRSRGWHATHSDSEDPEIPHLLSNTPSASKEAAAIGAIPKDDLQKLLQARLQASKRS